MAAKVLIIDSSSESLEAIKDMVEALGMTAFTASTGLDGINAAKQRNPGVIILELNLKAGEGVPMDGMEVLHTLGKSMRLSKIPIVMVSEETDKELVMECIKAGAKEFIVKPLEPSLLKEKLDKYLKTGLTKEGTSGALFDRTVQKERIKVSIGKKILAIDDDPFTRALYNKILKERGYKIRLVADGMDGLSEMLSNRPDILLLDLMMPMMNGFEVLKKMQSTESLKDIPVLVISANAEMAQVRRALTSGALGYILKPIRPNIMIAKIEEVFRGPGSEKDERKRIEKPLDGKTHILILSENENFIKEIRDGLNDPYDLRTVGSLDELEKDLDEAFSEFILLHEDEVDYKRAGEICARIKNIDESGVIKPCVYYHSSLEQSQIDEYTKQGVKECIKRPDKPEDLQHHMNVALEVNLVEVNTKGDDVILLKRKDVSTTAAGRELTRWVQDLSQQGSKKFIIDLSVLDDIKLEEIQHLSKFTNYQTKLGIQVRFVTGSENVKRSFKEFLETLDVLIADTVEEALENW